MYSAALLSASVARCGGGQAERGSPDLPYLQAGLAPEQRAYVDLENITDVRQRTESE